MSLPRLVATDLDGTLLDPSGEVSPRTREVLVALEAGGVPVVFVTGRPLRWMDTIFEHVGSHGLAVVSNGALVWDVTNDRARLTRALPGADALAACLRLRAAVPGISFAVEDIDGIGLETGFAERHQIPAVARRGALEDLLDRPVLKVLARHEELGAQEFWDRAEAAVGDVLTVTSSSPSALLEMSAPGVTKATTLAVLCAELGIEAADVVAFGDMPNDLAMLTWAGTSYAVADAHPSVLAAADHVVGSNADDGVATTLAGVFGL